MIRFALHNLSLKREAVGVGGVPFGKIYGMDRPVIGGLRIVWHRRSLAVRDNADLGCPCRQGLQCHALQ